MRSRSSIVIIALLLAIMLLGCKLSSLMPGSGGGPAPGGSGGTATGDADPRADVVAASKKFIDLKSFTANMDGMGQTPIQSKVEYAAPDRFHITYLGGTGAGIEMIMIGDQMFMKTGGKWSKMPTANKTSIPTLRDSFTEEGLKTLTDVKFEGEESVDGTAALAYSYKNQTPVGGYPFTSKIWLGKESGLPLKIIVD